MIIGISGKKGSGKDLSGMILQALTNKLTTFDGMEVITEKDVAYQVWDVPTFKNIKFADTLKNFICVLLGCTREKLEEREYKESVLPEVWWYWRLERESGYSTVLKPYKEATGTENYELIETTPRLLLQLMGTECGRQILHPNIWVNAVMSNYIGHPAPNGEWGGYIKFPNWVITDMRFPNELKAIKEKDGVTIRINRPKYLYEGKEHYVFDSKEGAHIWYDNMEFGNVSRAKNAFSTKEEALQMHREAVNINQHESETALDNAVFDYTIENSGTIKDLVNKIKEILIKEKII
jgi:hypothetical protein